MSAAIDRWLEPGYGDVRAQVIWPRIPRRVVLRCFTRVLIDSGEERPTAPVKKVGVMWSAMRAIRWGLVLIWSIFITLWWIWWGLVIIFVIISVVYTLWVSFEEASWSGVFENGLRLAVSFAIIGGLVLFQNSLATSNYLGTRGWYGLAEFFLKKMTNNLDDSSEALTRLGDLYFFGLGRDKDWREATTYYGRVLALDLKARQMAIDVFGPVMPDDVAIDWSEPDCLPNLKKMAEAGPPEAWRVLDSWRNDDPFKGLSTILPVNIRPVTDLCAGVAARKG